MQMMKNTGVLTCEDYWHTDEVGSKHKKSSDRGDGDGNCDLASRQQMVG